MKNSNQAVIGNQSSSAPQRLLYSLAEAAYSLSMSKRGLAYLVSNGTVPTVKIGGRTMIAARVLHQFAENGTSQNIVPTANGR